MRISHTLVCIAALASCFCVIGATESWASQDKLAKKYIETITTEDGQKLSFEMVLIPPALSCESKSGGTFLMGSPQGEAGRQDHEGPQHQVRLDPFYLCTTETTIELFLAYYQETVSSKEDPRFRGDKLAPAEAGVDAITGPTPVYGDLTMGYEKKHPAIGMTWHNAVTFCRWLSRKTGKEYRLPTEAEWEYACRAGTSPAPIAAEVVRPSACKKVESPTDNWCGIFGFGDDPNRLADFAWYKANSNGQTHEVAKRRPNACGLYDMSGNVREWVYDFYSPTAYNEAAASCPLLSCESKKGGAKVNPKGPKTGKVHVARGGDYDSSPEELRCAARAFEEEWWRSGDPQIPKSKWWLPGMDFIGFRVARYASTRLGAGSPSRSGIGTPCKDSHEVGTQSQTRR